MQARRSALGKPSAGSCLSAVLLCLVLQDAWAHSPHERLNPDERHRLRQELRLHSGDPRNHGMQGPALNNAAPPQGPAIPQGYPAPAGLTPGPGRMSPEDRRALRQQLREQYDRGEGPGRPLVPRPGSSMPPYSPNGP